MLSWMYTLMMAHSENSLVFSRYCHILASLSKIVNFYISSLSDVGRNFSTIFDVIKTNPWDYYYVVKRVLSQLNTVQSD